MSLLAGAMGAAAAVGALRRPPGGERVVFDSL
jgi:hypothetical protein